jgi:CDP-6-deoxy-D-xylo-4-hexulose-3-dehydrase
MWAAVGLAQLAKLETFIKKRRENWEKLYEGLCRFSDRFILPEACPDSIPSWFGFLVTVRKDAGFTRDAIVRYLEENNIQTRMLFAGNLIKHPCFDELRHQQKGYRVIGILENTDIIMRDSFWFGVYPGLTDKNLEFIINLIGQFVANH